MLGMLCPQERGRVRLERSHVAGLKVLCACVSRREQLGRAEKLLRRAGVKWMLPVRAEELCLSGLPAVDVLPLYRAMAERFVLAVLRRRSIPPEQATVVLRGEYPDGDLVAAARALCPRVRQVVIDTDRGSDLLQRQLLRQFGAAVIPITERSEMISVRFNGESRGEGLVLCDRVELDGLSVDVPQLDIPETLLRSGVLCALWQAGMIELSQFQISGAVRGNKYT